LRHSLPKKIGTAAVFLMLASTFSPAFTVQAGAFYGIRKVNDAKIKAAYKDGEVYFPFLEVQAWKGLTLSAGYEGGYEGTALLGPYNAKAELSVSGMEFLVGYEFRISAFAFFAKTGYGLYFYKQTVQDEYAKDYPVDHSQSTIVLKGGLKLYLGKFLFLAFEVKYVPLTVKPYDYEVDLGGMRYLLGLGASFDF
jgi:hypothetical protein